ncbi:GGDEF domain-containing protein [Woeseia oceani]|uniref:GGDEF domain-containing protein n=1 Tax=Woeseia oceani TaxID=1548547 RepID=UPI0009F4D668|nr:GGDEF domain-containing protein [Woeseia oceani]
MLGPLRWHFATESALTICQGRSGNWVERVPPINSDYQRSLLAGLDLFHGVSPDKIQGLLQQCERRDVGTGELLLSPGSRNEYVFVVLSGLLDVRVGSPDAPVLARMDVGSCAGEMSIIEGKDPSAYVIAAEPTHVLVIHKTVLWEMVNASHAFSKNLLLMLSERIRSHNHFIAESFGDLLKYERNASTDALTGLGNRHAMVDEFPAEIARCRKNREAVSMIMVDVDNFKTFNDQFGHVAGDRALTAVARVLRDQFRTRDKLVRFGGDEFAVLLPGVAEAEALKTANRVRIAINGDYEENIDSLIRIPIAISMGVAELQDDGTLDSLMHAADAALYRAKRAGRNQVFA